MATLCIDSRVRHSLWNSDTTGRVFEMPRFFRWVVPFHLAGMHAPFTLPLPRLLLLLLQPARGLHAVCMTSWPSLPCRIATHAFLSVLRHYVA